MATLAGQRAQFTWALNQYNLTDDADRRAYFARRMAKYVQAAPANGFSKEDVTQAQSYPADVVEAFLGDSEVANDADISEAQALETLKSSVDSTRVTRRGGGAGSVYVYGYKCAPDRFKIGCADGDTIQRIAAQIGTSTPDKPVLFLEFKTDNCRSLERALHAILTYRGRQIVGGGAEWFLTTLDEIERAYQSILSPV